MPTGLRPRVNEAREFLEIAKDFKDPKEIIREALSNSWDAGATDVSIFFDLIPIAGTRRKKIKVTIQDNGEGMSSEPRPDIGSSEIDRDVDMVGLKNPAQIRAIRHTRAQPFDRRSLVPEGLEESERKVDRIESLLGEGRNSFLDLINGGQLKTRKIGGMRLVSVASIKALGTDEE
jgi:Histidine kinase-, DNA gyrase B-, and HSP90-like ATPase